MFYYISIPKLLNTFLYKYKIFFKLEWKLLWVRFLLQNAALLRNISSPRGKRAFYSRHNETSVM